jgi:hypothetical protein
MKGAAAAYKDDEPAGETAVGEQSRSTKPEHEMRERETEERERDGGETELWLIGMGL